LLDMTRFGHPDWKVAMRNQIPAKVLALLASCVVGALCSGCGGAAHRAPPVYAPTPTKADAAGPVVPPVYLHLVAHDGTVLQRESEDGWADVCVAPCNGYVPAFGSYRVSLADTEPSHAFTMPGPPGTSISLKVDGEGTVWTRDSVQLAAQRAQSTASGAMWLALSGVLLR
jgi:hypothetical protein